MTTGEETIREAARVIAEFNACGHCDGDCASCSEEAQALAAAGLLRQEMTEVSPTEPSADLRMLASMLYQTHTALRDEGFTEQQALIIIGQIDPLGHYCCPPACAARMPGDVRKCEHGKLWYWDTADGGVDYWRPLSPIWTPIVYKRAIAAFNK